MRKNFSQISLIFFIFFVLFWLKGWLLVDTDFGWHLRMGQVILQSGIPSHDPFSYTMPSYPFVDHEWLTNVFLAIAYPLIGIYGIAFIFAFLTIAALAIQYATVPKKWVAVPLLLSLASLFSFSGIRPQTITWFLFSLLLWIILNKGRWQRFRYFLSFLFLLWANLHGGFAVGIVTLTFVVGFNTLSLKKIIWTDYAILVFCILATLINPYGIRLWWEVWMQLSDTALRSGIVEWMPAISFALPSLWFFVSLSLVVVWIQRKRYQKIELALFVIFLCAALGSVRHMPLWVIVAFPMVTEGIGWFAESLRRDKDATARLAQAHRVLLGIVVIWVVVFVGREAADVLQMRSKIFYPEHAVSYIHQHMPRGELFAPYAWGGYLIWHLPEKKVFIDGRMPSWRRSDAPKGESLSAMHEYFALSTGTTFEQAAKKYHIRMVLLPSPLTTTSESILDMLEKYFFPEKSKPTKSLYEHLVENGWRVVYKDSVAVVYARTR